MSKFLFRPPEKKSKNFNLTLIMKYTITLACLFTTFSFLLVDLLYNANPISLCQCNCSSCIFKSMFLLPLCLAGIGLCGDYIRHLFRKREQQKVQVYKQTIFSINHLVRNLQSKFVIISNSESIQKEFGSEIVELLNQSSQEIENTLEQLALLNDINPEMIKQLAFSK
ncbi:MAG: hypothetical protein D3923_09985 [Candidatus Electrothrix sp. AR3]|nr:hypothetical protein [Candidatus Electrothrix sp. AR3]